MPLKISKYNILERQYSKKPAHEIIEFLFLLIIGCLIVFTKSKFPRTHIHITCMHNVIVAVYCVHAISVIIIIIKLHYNLYTLCKQIVYFTISVPLIVTCTIHDSMTLIALL